jgi:hypothetical protein
MGVVLYDILLDGFHTPLTREEISELYDAGRLKPHDPCKHAAKNEWRTVDEHFPLRNTLRRRYRWRKLLRSLSVDG